MEAGKPGFGAWFENKINRKTGTGKSRLSILSFRQENLLFRQEKNGRSGKKAGPSEAGRSYQTELSPPCVLRQLEGETPSRALNMRVKWLGETKPAASAISVMLNPGVQEHHSRRFPKRIMALHGRQPRFLIPEHPRNIAAENPPVIFRFGNAYSREETLFLDAGTVPVA